MRLLFALLLAVASGSAFAAQSWYGPYTIKKIQRYWDGGNRTVIYVNEKMNTGCQKTDTDSVVTVPSDYGEHLYHNGVYSGALAAQAQNRKIRLMLDNGCDSKYGKRLYGIEISEDS